MVFNSSDPEQMAAGLAAATDFRVLNISREVRDWLAAGDKLLRQIASDFAADLDPQPLLDLAYALETVVAEFDAGEPESEES